MMILQAIFLEVLHLELSQLLGHRTPKAKKTTACSFWGVFGKGGMVKTLHPGHCRDDMLNSSSLAMVWLWSAWKRSL